MRLAGSWQMGALLAVVLALVACVRDSTDNGPSQPDEPGEADKAGEPAKAGEPSGGQGAPSMMNVDPVAAASAATRMMVSPGGTYVLAELAGEWREQAYAGRGEEIPPVLKLIERASGEVVATATGWALGPPTDDGDMLYIEEHGQEYSYRVRSLKRPDETVALAPPAPAERWAVRAAVGAPGRACATAVLWSPIQNVDWRDRKTRKERLWLAAIDTAELKVTGTETVDTAVPMLPSRRYGVGIAANPASGDVYVVELPEPGGTADWHVTALRAGTLERRWRTSVPPYDPAAHQAEADDSSGRRSRRRRPPRVQPAAPTASRERAIKSALVSASGDGSHVAVVYGVESRISVGVHAIRVLDAGSGKLTGTLGLTDMELSSPVSEVTPVPGTASVALLHVGAFRQGSGGAETSVFYGVTTVDTTEAEQTAAYKVTRASLGEDTFTKMRALVPGAAAASSADRVLLAPQGYAWVRAHASGGDWPEGEGRGLQTPELRGVFDMPAEWHRPGRPRVEAHDEHFDAR